MPRKKRPAGRVVNRGGKPEFKGGRVRGEKMKPAAALAAAGLDKFMEKYSPDPEQAKVKYDDLYARAAIPQTDKDNKPTSISGRFLAASTGRRQFRAHELAGWNQVKALAESKGGRIKRMRERTGITHHQASTRLREAFTSDGKVREGFDWFSVGEPTDPVSSGGRATEFHPLLLGPFYRNLYIYDFLDQASKAFEAWNHNPIAKAIVNIILHYVYGDGIRVEWANPVIGAAWEKWCESVQWSDKRRKHIKDLSIIGENMPLMPLTAGFPRYKLIDSSTVWEIVTNPRDVEEQYYLHRQFPTQWQIPYTPTDTPGVARKPEGFRPLGSEYVVEQISAEDWIQVMVNATLGEKRGRSDLFSVLGWLKRFKDWFNAGVVKAHISNAFVVWWDVNGSNADVEAIINNQDLNALPPPGSAWVTNKAAVPHLLTPSGGITAGDKTGEQLLAVIATSLNIPPEFLGAGGGTTRATALTRKEPVGKLIESRQQVQREEIEWECKRFITCLKAGAILPMNQPREANVRQLTKLARSGDFNAARAELEKMSSKGMLVDALDVDHEIIMAQVEPVERSIYLKDVAGARVGGAISHRRYSTLTAESLDQKDYDYDTEQAEIQEEKERGITMPGMARPERGAPGQAPGNGKPQPGSPEDVENYRSQGQARSNRGG